MDVKILHLYNNLMNLYGDYANVTVLKKHLEDQGANVQITFSDTLNDIDLLSFDFLYIGSATEKNQKQALENFILHKDMILEYTNNKKIALLTGNAFEMLGKTITDANGKIYTGVCLCPFETAQQNRTRLTSDVIADCKFLLNPLVGFINKCSKISGIDNPINKVKLGLGNDNVTSDEGLRIKNILGTHLIGPVLVKNPEFMQYLVTLILKSKDNDFKYKKFDYTYLNDAYKITLEKLKERIATPQ